VFTGGTAPFTSLSALTPQEFTTLGRAAAFRTSAAVATGTHVVSSPGIEPAHVVLARVTGDLFGTLGAYPVLGRSFSPAEIAAGTPVVVLSHDLWQRRFSRDPAIAGRPVLIAGARYTVVGVMPQGRGYPARAEMWRPSTPEEMEDDDRDLEVLARLRNDVSIAGASSEISALAHNSSKGARTVWAEELRGTDVANVSAALKAIFAAAIVTLLIVCANVAALVGGGSADRVEEMAIRRAVGATRGRVFTQLIVESLVLAIAGGAPGLLFSQWALALLLRFAPVSIPRLAEITVDGRILAIGLAATVLTGIAVGLAPAIKLSALTAGSGGRRITRRSTGRRVLVLIQVSLAVVLTVSAGLLVQSLKHLIAIDQGFAADKLVAVDLSLRGVFDGDSGQLFADLMARVQRLPGVASVSASMPLPTQTIGIRASVQLIGDSATPRSVTWRPITPGYLDTAGIPLLAGRKFTAGDTRNTGPVAIANAAFVKTWLDGRPAVGARVATNFSKSPLSIVGVAGDVTPAGEPDRPALYVVVDQFPIGGGHLLVRARDDPRAILPALAATLRNAAPALAMDRIRRLADDLEAGRAVTRFSTQLAATFAGLALLLSMIGVYGLAAGEVSARWREIAVRLALGASNRDAFWTVIRPCAAILAAGASMGVLAALSVGPALKSQLHGIGPVDAPTLIFAPALLGIVGMVAAALAAARVLRADPAATLRSE